MISRMLGAPFGGTTLGGHHGVDSLAVSLITPPNVGSGGGSCLPLMVMVASGEPGVPLICWAKDDAVVKAKVAHNFAAHWTESLRFMMCFLIYCSALPRPNEA